MVQRPSRFVFGYVALASMAIVGCSSETPTAPSNTAPKEAGTSGASFRTDVVPIVRASCARAACHLSKESNLGIYLGFDAAQIYDELQKTSPTTSEKFVVPSDPAKSYLLLKLEGKQSTLAKCSKGECGAEMPPGDPLPEKSIAVFRAWIQAGAKDD